jgi:toxin ParE1/3/4
MASRCAPQAENDLIEAAHWYDNQREGLGDEFIEEVIAVLTHFRSTLCCNCVRHPTKNIRWRYPKRFPYRVVYEVVEAEYLVIIAAVAHAARHDREWRKRV